jgi:hypothetical protein
VLHTTRAHRSSHVVSAELAPRSHVRSMPRSSFMLTFLARNSGFTKVKRCTRAVSCWQAGRRRFDGPCMGCAAQPRALPCHWTMPCAKVEEDPVVGPPGWIGRRDCRMPVYSYGFPSLSQTFSRFSVTSNFFTYVSSIKYR